MSQPEPIGSRLEVEGPALIEVIKEKAIELERMKLKVQPLLDRIAKVEQELLLLYSRFNEL